MVCDKHGIEYEDVQQEIAGRIFHFGMCAECSKEVAEAEKEMQERQKHDSSLSFYTYANIEPSYYDVSFDNFIADTDDLKRAKACVEKMATEKHGKIIMLGKNGTGKTHLAVCAVKIVGGKILTMYEISTRIRATYTPRAKEDELDVVDELARIPLLVIDEIGRTKGSDAETNWLSYIIDKRHVRDLPLILISNKHIRRSCEKQGCNDCLENYISEDILSRLSEDGIRLQFGGIDYRMKKRQEK